jgi:seryl-tRNA synthetase
MKLSQIPTTPLNLIPPHQTMDFALDVYANHIIPSLIKFVDQPVIVQAEVAAIQTDIANNERKANQITLKPTKTPKDEKELQTLNELVEKLKKDLETARQREDVINGVFQSELKRVQDQMRNDLAGGMLNMLHDRLETQNRVIEQLTSQWTYSVLQQQ